MKVMKIYHFLYLPRFYVGSTHPTAWGSHNNRHGVARLGSKDSFYLRFQGDHPHPEVTARRKKVKRGYRRSETYAENAKRLGIEQPELENDLRYLRQQPDCPANLALKKDLELATARREKVKKGYRRHETRRKNAKRLGIALKDLKADLQYWRKQL